MLLAVAALSGCASESATVSFGYAVNPVKGLPRGMKVITVQASTAGETTDPKWSDFVTTTIQQMVSDSRARFGTDVRISDRRDTDATFDEADLSAAGMSTRKGGGSGGKILAAQGTIRCTVNTKIENIKGKHRTISGLSGHGYGGHGWGGGGGSISTEEVETITRNMTVQADCRLIDTANNEIWEQLPPKMFQRTDEEDSGFFFGSSKTEADLESSDAIIGSLVQDAVREFLSRIMKIRIEVTETLESSGNENCITGVKMLRAEMFEEALANFKLAIAEDADDHEAAFGAGIACEATGRFDEALKYYKLACVGDDNPKYARCRDRVKTYGARAVR